MITVKDWMSEPVNFISPEKSVSEACKEMDKHNIGSMLVSDESKKPLGIITERDVLRKIIAEKADPEKVKVKEIMSKKVTCVHKDASLLQVSKIMTTNVFRRVLVEDNDGTIVGIITSKDLLQMISG